jgi:hypothetical protein
MKTVSTAAFRENRARFPLDQLRKHDGQWVAFSADGQRIVASGASIVDLAEQVRLANEELRDVMIEHIEMDTSEINLGAAEML